MSVEFKPYPFEARQYTARLPELDNGRETQRHAVTIVGGGPVGFAVALGLARHGVRSVLKLGESGTPLFLARFALLAIERIGNAQAAPGMIDAARDDLIKAVPH